MTDFNPDVDYYEILQVHPSAHQEIIKRAYRTLVGILQAHPDLGGTHEDAVRVNEAYQVLSHPELRKSYDEARRERQAQAARMDAARSTAASTMRTRTMPHAPPTAPPRRGERRYATATSGGGTRTVKCPRCGAHNRLPVLTTQQRAICGRCHTPLVEQQQPPSRESLLPGGDIPLARTLMERLVARGELHLLSVAVPADRQYTCLRCRHSWSTRTAREGLPAKCPRCRRTNWNSFRLFRCRLCGHQFPCTNLRYWPYLLFRECPSCHNTHWHAGCEKHPLRWFFNRLLRNR
jgi:ribosomal protein S27AE